MSEKNIETLMREERHDFGSLVDIMRILRSDNGCPWDREQNHASIRGNFIEETYEVVEAIDNEDAALLREELGDVLLQVIFHARISQEEGQFSIDDVIHDICAKLIHRHPHIFGNVQADTSEVVLDNWEKIKKEEKQRIGLSGTLNSIPPSLPALMRAQKIVKKCSKENAAPTSSQAQQELSRAAAGLREGDTENLKQNLRSILVASAVIAQNNGLDCEEILYDACRRVTSAVSIAESVEQISACSTEADIRRAFFSE